MSNLTIEEKLELSAPVARVWAFLLAPERVVACLPGAALDEVIDARTFRGNVKVKVGPVAMTYAGKASLTEVDETTHSVTILGEGKEKAGADVVSMTMRGRVEPLAAGGSELSVKADVLLTGKIVKFGRGMIQAVSAQLFKDFAARMRTELEMEPEAEAQAAPAPAPVNVPVPVPGSAPTPASAPPPAPAPAPASKPSPGLAALRATTPASPQARAALRASSMTKNEPVNAFGLLFRTLWSTLTRFIRRLVARRNA